MFLLSLVFVSLATSATGSDLPAGLPRPRLARTKWNHLYFDIAALYELPSSDEVSTIFDFERLSLALRETLTSTVLGAAETTYAVPLLPGATVGELWQALAARDGTLSRANYYLRGLRHLRLARTKTLADALAAKLPGALPHLVRRFLGAPPVDGEATAVAVHDHFVIVPRQALITAFHPEGLIDATLSGDHNETATNTRTDYHGYALLGPWVPRGTPLRARLRLESSRGEGAGAKIGLVREEAWDDVREPSRDNFKEAGWSYCTYGGHLFSADPTVYNGLPRMTRVGGVVEVEVRWDAEASAGELLYTIDGDPQAPARATRRVPRFNYTMPRDPGPWNAFQIPAEGGRVALAVSLQNVDMMLV